MSSRSLGWWSHLLGVGGGGELMMMVVDLRCLFSFFCWVFFFTGISTINIPWHVMEKKIWREGIEWCSSLSLFMSLHCLQGNLKMIQFVCQHDLPSLQFGLDYTAFRTSWNFLIHFLITSENPGSRKWKCDQYSTPRFLTQKFERSKIRGESLLHISRWCCDLDDCVRCDLGGINMWRFSTLRLHTPLWGWHLDGRKTMRRHQTYIDSCFFFPDFPVQPVQNLYIMHGTAWWNHTLHPEKTRH